MRQKKKIHDVGCAYRFLVLEANTGLFYYVDDKRKEKKGQIDLSEIQYVTITRNEDDKLLTVKNKEREFWFRCYSKLESDEWYKALTTFKDQIRMQQSIAKYQNKLEEEMVQEQQHRMSMDTSAHRKSRVYSPDNSYANTNTNNNNNNYNNNSNSNDNLMLSNSYLHFNGEVEEPKSRLSSVPTEIEGQSFENTGCFQSANQGLFLFNFFFFFFF
ncbi:hypothetical protein RFI_10301 [Reticulomyxa filosa]|uniref:PH domain-containing protein n=1 Tax=Reticulomyxa filosa TaxID=46433 RepID=X6NKJ3_RETFI|nr:hypothetical protein RFI_10301 [Reticulomyxa filosa]|eukprot:ETO26835.1 hypothetical protein RFI_10301 [Reticulomyxa filosa]